MKLAIICGSVIVIIIIVIIYLSTTHFKKITYHKCLEKPHTDLLDGVLRRNGFSRNDQKYNFYMPCGYNNIEQELKNIDVPPSKYIFGLIGCDQIVSKNNLWDVLEKTYGRHSAKQLMPESFLIENPHQYAIALQEVRHGTVLICKKNLQRKLGLALVFTEDDLERAKKDEFKVAQRFLKNTTQIHGRKMNMRIYFMIRKHKGKIQFFVNTNGKVLYTKNKTTGNITFETHITSFQMDADLYEKENMPHDFNELKKVIGKEAYGRIWAKIIDKIKYLSKAIAPIFSEVKYKDKVCFQLFGMDVILEDGEPYILEINKGPDMIPKCKKDEKLKKNIYEATFQVAGLLKMRLKPSNYVKIYETDIAHPRY